MHLRCVKLLLCRTCALIIGFNDLKCEEILTLKEMQMIAISYTYKPILLDLLF